MSSNKVPVSEGTIPFEVEGVDKECFTWYKVFGELKSGARPLIALHGGPGVGKSIPFLPLYQHILTNAGGHSYLLSLADLATNHNIPVIFYDQFGCGKSTHLQEKKGDTAFWTVDLFLNELANLISHFGIQSYDLFGNSWGGMLAAEHGITKPRGLRKLIIADSPASMKDWVVAANILLQQLPKDVQETLEKCEKAGDFTSPEYQTACKVFYCRHVCRLDPWPQEVSDTFANLDGDNTVYLTMNGPSEFTITGPLKEWSVKGKLGAIENEVLLMNGRYDEAMDLVVEPFWKEIGGKVRWITFAESSHMPHWEERERFMEVVAGFLED